MRVAVEGLSLFGPGLGDWEVARECLRGERVYEPEAPPIPQVALLSRNERRRLTGTIRIALALAHAACRGLDEAACARLPAVFASAAGDAEIADRLCTALASPGRPVSPTQFHNSVHNAPAGYWAIATGSRAASTSVASGVGTAAAGLLEAATRCVVGSGPVLLVVYDLLPPSLLRPRIGIETSFGMALRLGPAGGGGSGLSLRMSDEPESALPEPWERLRLSNPAARMLSLAHALACREQEVRLPYTEDQRLAVMFAHDH